MSYPPPGPPPGPQQPPPGWNPPPAGQPPYAPPAYGQPQYAPPAYGQPYPQYAAPQPPHWDPRAAAHPHSEPRTYPLILRTWDYAWWKPVVGLLVGLLLFFVVQVVLLGILVVGVLVDGGSGTFEDRFLEASQMDKVTPWSMLYINLGLASLTLIAFLLVRVVHRLRPRWLTSVLPGMRWKFFFACLGLGLVALGVSLVLGTLLPQDPNDLSGSAEFPTGQLLATAIVILLTTPLQALGEEYGFRGYLMQAFGSLTHGIVESWGISKKAANLIACGFALVVTSGLFALAHGAQNFPLFFDRFAFGLMAGLVVILVGGLEAGIALHILNNLLAFGIAIAFGQLDSALTVSEVSWWQLPLTVVQNGLFLVLVLFVARRMGLRGTTSPPVAEPAAQPVG